jgi:hypothetical protein
MTQAPLDLDPAFDHRPATPSHPLSPRSVPLPRAPAAAEPPRPAPVAAGFELGWDHARHGLVPPADLLAPDSPVCQGWMAGRAVSGRRAPTAPRLLRRWLALRTAAWREGAAFDAAALTPQHLARLEVTHCPVLRQTLGGTSDDPLGAVVQPLDAARGWTAGNLVMLSRAAAAALRATPPAEALRHAQRLTLDPGAVSPAHPALDAAAWGRLATLRAMALDAPDLPWHEAAALPGHVLPPPDLTPRHALLRLRASLALLFAQAGWAQHTRTLAARLPAGALRTDWHLLVGALATRWLEQGAPACPRTRRLALEDAWQHPRVQRRWQHLALQLDAGACDTLLGALQSA